MNDAKTLEPKLAPTPDNIGKIIARRMFESRGNNYEIHLLERDLAELLKGAAEIALDGVGTRNVEALTASRDELAEALSGLLAECDRHGCFEHVGFDFPTVKPVFDAARAALAKVGAL